MPNVLLVNVSISTCPSCGNYEVDIPRVEELNTVLAETVAMAPGKLTGTEIRFLRKTLGWSGADLARRFGVQPESASRWENDKLPMNGQAQRLLRVLVLCEKPIQSYDNVLLDNTRRPALAETICVRRDDDRWRTQHHAAGQECMEAK